MAYKFTGIVNRKWIEATNLVGERYTPARIKLGWPVAMEPHRIACLQYPQQQGSYEYQTGQRYINTALLAACEAGSIACVTFDRVDYGQMRNGKIEVVGQWKEFAVEAKDVAAWLAAQKEAPSEHICAWFEANNVTTKAEPPAPSTPQPKRRRNLITPLIEAAQRECPDSSTPAIFALLRTWAASKPPRPPLLGVTEDGIQWVDGNDQQQELSIKNLRDRLQRAKAR